MVRRIIQPDKFGGTKNTAAAEGEETKHSVMYHLSMA
jgi:hypothetical protein